MIKYKINSLGDKKIRVFLKRLKFNKVIFILN